VAASDADAWRELIDRYGGMVWSITRAQGLDRSDAADVYQTVWMRLVDHHSRLLQPERLGGWLATTTRRECIRVSRLRNRTTATDDTRVFDGLPGMTDAFDPAASVVSRERQLEVQQVLGTLPDRPRRLLQTLMAEPSISYGEVAEVLQMPIGSIGPTRQRCLRALRARCVDAGIEP
jgi:RNA polymerase sigma factor (sigma-70 family)